ncbi:hypothetical protein [Pedobacter frigidisoli]|nr:hypothetical protein [Pedobacter frigidisoli]
MNMIITSLSAAPPYAVSFGGANAIIKMAAKSMPLPSGLVIGVGNSFDGL